MTSGRSRLTEVAVRHCEAATPAWLNVWTWLVGDIAAPGPDPPEPEGWLGATTREQVSPAALESVRGSENNGGHEDASVLF